MSKKKKIITFFNKGKKVNNEDFIDFDELSRQGQIIDAVINGDAVVVEEEEEKDEVEDMIAEAEVIGEATEDVINGDAVAIETENTTVVVRDPFKFNNLFKETVTIIEKEEEPAPVVIPTITTVRRTHYVSEEEQLRRSVKRANEDIDLGKALIIGGIAFIVVAGVLVAINKK